MLKSKLQSSTAKVPPSQVVAAGLRAFFRMAEHWGLSREQELVLLGRPSHGTFYNWRKGDVGKSAQNVDLATRLSYLVGIFKALEILYQDSKLADRWVAQPNLRFGGRSALDHMMSGQITELAEVRRYLDSVRGVQ